MMCILLSAFVFPYTECKNMHHMSNIKLAISEGLTAKFLRFRPSWMLCCADS